MAARWVPAEGTAIDANERVGRRLFDFPGLVGAADQRPPKDFLDPRLFLETRQPGDVSLDRLGRTGIEKKVVAWLVPRGHAAAATFKPKRRFDGWVVVKARSLAEAGEVGPLNVVASPQRNSEPDHPDYNPYHAHVRRLPLAETGIPGFMTALAIRHVFEKHPEFAWCERKSHFSRIVELIARHIPLWLRRRR